MSNRKEKIAQIENDANELIENLKALHESVESYDAAYKELKNTNSSLSSLIEETQGLTKESHKIIKTIQEIGSSEILESIYQIELQIKRNNIIYYVLFSIVTILLLINLIIK